MVANAAIAYDDGFYGGSVNTLTFPSSPGGIPNFPDFFGANFQFTDTAVPEPGTALFGLALIGASLSRAHRKPVRRANRRPFS